MGGKVEKGKPELSAKITAQLNALLTDIRAKTYPREPPISQCKMYKVLQLLQSVKQSRNHPSIESVSAPW